MTASPGACGPFPARRAYAQSIDVTGKQRWRTELAAPGDTGSVTKPPVLAGGRLIVATGGVDALDEQTGQQLWSWTKGHAVYDMWLAGNQVVVLSDQVGPDAALTALNTADGHEVWRLAIPTGGLLGTVVRTESNRLAWVRADGAVQVVDLQSGKLVWTHPGVRSPAITAVDDRVIFAGGGTVTAWDEATGRQAWTMPGAPSDPAVTHVGERVLLWSAASGGTSPTALTALSSMTGGRLWTYDSGTPPYAVHELAGRVLTFDLSAHLAALDGSTGRPVWQVQAPRENLDAPPVVLADKFIEAEGGNGRGKPQLVARSPATGAVLWNTPLSQQIYGSQPLLAVGSLIIAQSLGGGSYGNPSALTAYRSDTGRAVWSASVASDAQAPTAVDGTTLFISSADPQQACAA